MTRPKATFYDEALLRELAGPDGAREFATASADGKAALWEWLHTMRAASDKGLFGAAKVVIDAEADYGTRGDRYRDERAWIYTRLYACDYEAQRRYLAAGHSETCYGATIYHLANRSFRSGTYNLSTACTCGKGDEA